MVVEKEPEVNTEKEPEVKDKVIFLSEEDAAVPSKVRNSIFLLLIKLSEIFNR